MVPGKKAKKQIKTWGNKKYQQLFYTHRIGSSWCSLDNGQKFLPGIAELSLLISALACLGRGKGWVMVDLAATIVEKGGFMFNHWMLEHGAIMAIYVWNMFQLFNDMFIQTDDGRWGQFG